MINAGYETKKARIEMLPLIDVIFLLLVYFIYAMASMVENKSIKVELPFAKTAQVQLDENVTISIKKDNSIFLGKERVDEVGLIKELARLNLSKESIHVVINGHENADLGIGIEILDLVRNAGISEVSFACRKKPL